MYSTIGEELNDDLSGLGWRKLIFLDDDMQEKRFFYIFVPSDLWPLQLKFAPLVTLVQRYVFTKLEVSTDFLFQ